MIWQGKNILKHRMLLVGLSGFLTVVTAGPASADAIDGDWCNGGRHILIDGPSAITPGGNKITGDYDRHAFSYQIPSTEKGAGGKVFLIVRSDEEMHFWQTAGDRPSANTPAEVWRRCQNIS
jgi:hypothetical protein